MDQPIDLASIRTTLGLTQAELAVEAGVDVATVWRWENQGIPGRGPARAFVERLAVDAAAFRFATVTTATIGIATMRGRARGDRP